MPVDLNLLPENLQVSKGIGGFLKTAKAMSVISIVAFTVFALIIGGLFIITRIDLTNTETNVEQLKSQVKAQETSEQQLVLIKDRLAKIVSVKGSPNASKNIININTLFENMSPDSTLNQANISSSKVDATLIIKSNDDLTNFLNNVKNTPLFNSVDLSSLSFNSNIGYSVTVSLGNK